jgi:hypothetical protein
MKTPRGATALGTVFLFLALMIILYVVWLYTGGPTRSISHSGPFIAQPPIPKLNTSNYTGADLKQMDPTLEPQLRMKGHMVIQKNLSGIISLITAIA